MDGNNKRGRTALAKPLLLAALASALYGCGPTELPPPSKQVQVQRFAGVALPGRAADARAAGFKDCEASYYGYTCQFSGKFIVLGVEAKAASVTLNGRDKFTADPGKAKNLEGDVRSMPPEVISYDEITVAFATPNYDQRCVDKATRTKPSASWDRPVGCLLNRNSMPGLRDVLERGSWQLVNSRRGYRYMHPQEGVSIDLRDNAAQITPVSAEIRDGILKELANRRAAEKAKEDAGRKFVNDMAK
ncbi:putative small lipoprotein YifL [Variovorax boronicumulans]|uniref:hypothetical protein n=1 Tax=Variovorax boronicumulans TaxID=436515 RepID=UPI0027893287|nr:hypothetical protein [Variovorax boronicumulans]MDP9993846.1 putative small lipoprotein YifL [Variovorax boronicumulans]MDQ0005290.1 putative small lipoprotein YifL [Variovorax boronicumulans]